MTHSFIFVPYQAHIAAEFWQILSKKKIDEDKLRDHETLALAHYSFPSRSDRSASSIRLDLTQDSFEVTKSSISDSCIARGFIRNTNTLEEFKTCDKNAFLYEAASRVWEDIISGAALAEPTLLASFALLCFSDLKKYVYTYWMAHPALPLTATYQTLEALESDATSTIHQSISEWRHKTDPTQWGFFVYDEKANQVHVLSDWDKVPESDRYFGFVDPSATENAVGWPARNLLLLLSSNLRLREVNLLGYRGARGILRYKGCTLDQTSHQADAKMPRPTGWERNNAGKLAPRVVNLGAVMDPTKLADDAVDLNLKLMTWRIAPDLNLKTIKDCRCLLLGAGTLGCYVARLLLGWGARTITFVDSGRVSFSNPVRQPLFNFSDCLDQGKPKAETAAAALREIYPGVQSTGHKLTVPMIGHPSTNASESKADYEKLVDLIQSHDVVFLLMDSRESRWLPTVICQALSKQVINAALGFDNYLVLRHGVPSSSTNDQLGCYFCNDVVQPGNSTQNQALDQQCTVTRPGLAALASATAVELLMSILQHPDRGNCDASSHGELGLVPHTIRGYLRTWDTKVLKGSKYPQCAGCSQAIVGLYKESGWAFVERACCESGWVEEVSGLKAVQDGIQGLDLDWNSDEDDDEVE